MKSSPKKVNGVITVVYALSVIVTGVFQIAKIVMLNQKRDELLTWQGVGIILLLLLVIGLFGYILLRVGIEQLKK